MNLLYLLNIFAIFLSNQWTNINQIYEGGLAQMPSRIFPGAIFSPKISKFTENKFYAFFML